MTKRRPLALGAAATIGFGSLFFAAPALAEDQAQAPDTDQIENLVTEALVDEETSTDLKLTEEEDQGVEEFIASAEAQDLPIVAVGKTGAGALAVVTSEPLPEASVEAQAIRNLAEPIAGDNASVEIIDDRVTQVLEPYAATDVVGGAPYLIFDGGEPAYYCSIGFSAWTPGGDPAVLTAGHCAGDAGTLDVTQRALPSEQPAAGGQGAAAPIGALGNFGYVQFGGPGNADAQDRTKWPDDPTSVDSAASYDLAAVDGISGDLQPLPEVTDWTTGGSDDLSASTRQITGVGDPVVGDISKSGRTTGKTDGVVVADDLTDGYALIRASNEPGDNRARWVRGFSSTLQSAGGDSGGAVYQGETAVGIVSGGDDNFTWSASLTDIPEELSGYAVQLHIDAPAAPSQEKVGSGSTITADAPEGATRVFVDGEERPVEDGQYTFTAPESYGDASVELVAGNAGFDRSETTVYEFEVGLAKPTVNAVDQDSSDVTVTGTGVPGAEVTATIDDREGTTETATVGENGEWSVEYDLEVGEYTVTATQEADGETSDEQSASVIVRPAEPEITSIIPGQEFENANAPAGVSGTGSPGAKVTLDLTQSETTSAMVDGAKDTVNVENDGTWSFNFEGALKAGSYTLSVTQTENEVASYEATVSFVVLAAPNDADANGGDAGGAADGADNGGEDGDAGTDDGDLANTGAGSMLPFALGAVLLLAAGGGAILIAQRRQAGAEL